MVFVVGDPGDAVAIYRHPKRGVQRVRGRRGGAVTITQVARDIGLTEDTIGVRAVGQACRTAEAQHAVVHGIGDPEGAVAAHRHPIGVVQRVRGRRGAAVTIGQVAHDIGLAEEAVGIAEIAGAIDRRPTPRVGEAQHAVVVGVGEPEGTGDVHRHSIGVVQRVRVRRGTTIDPAAREIDLTENAVGVHAVAQARQTGEAQHAVVEAVGDKDRTRCRIHHHPTGKVQRVRVHRSATIDLVAREIGLTEDAVGIAEIAGAIDRRPTPRVGEAQHAVVVGVGDPEGTGDVYCHTIGNVQRVRRGGAVTIELVAREIGLTENAVGGHAVAQACPTGEAQHAVVAAVGNENLVRRRIHRYPKGGVHAGGRGSRCGCGEIRLTKHKGRCLPVSDSAGQWHTARAKQR